MRVSFWTQSLSMLKSVWQHTERLLFLMSLHRLLLEMAESFILTSSVINLTWQATTLQGHSESLRSPSYLLAPAFESRIRISLKKSSSLLLNVLASKPSTPTLIGFTSIMRHSVSPHICYLTFPYLRSASNRFPNINATLYRDCFAYPTLKPCGVETPVTQNQS